MIGRRCGAVCAWPATYAARPRCARLWSVKSAPGERAVTDADLDEHIRANSITVHHPLGTCKMGLATDPMAVVDSELRVFGTEGLRVVDGSVMPNLVGGNINAPIIMIAEKAADLILGRPLLGPSRSAPPSLGPASAS